MSKIIAVSNKAIRGLTTPQLLNGGLYLTWVTSVLLLISIISGVQAQRQAIKTVGQDSTPSIVTAQRLKDGLAGMDANVVNELLVPTGQNQDAVKGYEERYLRVTERLVAAAESISFGEIERKPIETMHLALGNYLAKIQQARDSHARGDNNAMLIAYRAASEIMDKTLLPAADELDKVNLQALDATYTQKKAATQNYIFSIFLIGLALIILLGWLQIFLSRQMRRTFNPALLLATAIALGFLNHTAGALLAASQNLRVATEDAFTSMHTLRQARAIAYIANTAKSRYLLDPALASNHEQAFLQNIAKIAQVPPGKTIESVVEAYKSEYAKVDGFTGYLADELKNIVFPGEKAATLANLSSLGTYMTIDRQIRQLEKSGNRQQAIALSIGNNPGQSSWAFEQLRITNQKAFDINQAAFDKAIQQGFRNLAGFEIKATVALSAIALLTLFGLTPRLKEYSI
ncbi:hypothetical protein H6G41_13080 [Tolypothrix sp. FACHB-123]|uniref:hypothetical protein n=1 Tax=Tolypothrix sp. FACHB-123 TaxID=2692868 RepID=UPI0016853D9F|nr:hypothetical protein [Tolypothrix sp. FACHB-123]MBD2355536.1 hypothetical protein [Tolypothrix sp. FACHB-123]